MTSYLEQEAQRIRSLVPPGTNVPDQADALFLIYAVLVRAKGEQVTDSDIHDAWVAWMTTQNPDHDALRPYADLNTKTRRFDAPFALAVRKAARSKDNPPIGDDRPETTPTPSNTITQGDA